jgi:pantoate--beta-alanine ligase
MDIYHSSALLTSAVLHLREAGRTIGFVPTMGALHEGHLSLVRISKNQNDFTVASIFVNPTQFNDKSDLKKYPRMPERDQKMLSDAGCDALFMPSEQEIYPEPDTRVFDFGILGSVMEGEHRPGHFNGVAQVVTRLFDIVRPHKAYFGLKDFQQLAIIKKVTSDLNYPVDIIPCPIIREQDGLAMSSRNMLLSREEHESALILSKSLFMARDMKPLNTPGEVKEKVTGIIKSTPGFELEYFEIVHATSLLPVGSWGSGEEIVGCLAARVGKVRLIDNINFSS